MERRGSDAANGVTSATALRRGTPTNRRRTVATARVHRPLPRLSIVGDPAPARDNRPGGDAAVTTWARLGRVHVRRASATGSVLPVNVLHGCPTLQRRGRREVEEV